MVIMLSMNNNNNDNIIIADEIQVQFCVSGPLFMINDKKRGKPNLCQSKVIYLS